MINLIKLKITILTLITIFTMFADASIVHAQTENKCDPKDGYCLLAPIPLTGDGTATKQIKFADYIPGVFRLMVSLATGLAVVMLIYAGIKYMSTDAFGEKSEARGIIENALWGLLLAIGAWLIVFTIFPSGSGKLIFDLKLDPIQIATGTPTAIIGPGGTVTSTGTLSQTEAMSQLRAASIGIDGGILLDGVRQATINEVIRLKGTCTNCNITVTSTTGGVHNSGTCSHANGWKVDLRKEPNLDSYITRTYAKNPLKRSDGADVYTAPSGALYALEGNHWDVVVPCL